MTGGFCPSTCVKRHPRSEVASILERASDSAGAQQSRQRALLKSPRSTSVTGADRQVQPARRCEGNDRRIPDQDGSTEVSMKSGEGEDGERTVVGGRTALHGAHLRTLDALFRHPTAHNLEWMDVIALFEKIGTVH